MLPARGSRARTRWSCRAGDGDVEKGSRGWGGVGGWVGGGVGVGGGSEGMEGTERGVGGRGHQTPACISTLLPAQSRGHSLKPAAHHCRAGTGAHGSTRRGPGGLRDGARANDGKEIERRQGRRRHKWARKTSICLGNMAQVDADAWGYS